MEGWHWLPANAGKPLLARHPAASNEQGRGVTTTEKTWYTAIGVSAVLLLLVPGCGGRGQALNVSAPPGQKIHVQMRAWGFGFDPDVITARRGDVLVFDVNNVSGETHNLTVKDPSGKVITDTDLPPHRITAVEVPLETVGTYPLYCDKPFHAALGMKGRIEAGT
jgi:plastocyanin